MFVVWPSDIHGYTLLTTFMRGALLGLSAYAAYDLTNQAVVKGWTWKLTLIDLAWGSLMTGIVSAGVVLI